MQSDQQLCETAAQLLIDNRVEAGLPDNVQILPLHSIAPMKRPALIVATEQMKSPHKLLRTGTFLLRYLADADDVDAAPDISQARLQAAVDWLTTGPGRSALKDALQAQGIWLRKLNPGDGITDQDGDRGRVYDQRSTVWMQTGAAPL